MASPISQSTFYQQGYYYGFAKASIIKYIMVILGGVIPFLQFTLLFFLSLATRIKHGNCYKNNINLLYWNDYLKSSRDWRIFPYFLIRFLRILGCILLLSTTPVICIASYLLISRIICSILACI